jgi:acetylglutamate kinase
MRDCTVLLRSIESSHQEPHFIADAATMDIVEMVLTGRVNKGLVSLIQMAGGQAVGLCGKDSNLLTARQMIEKDIGFVGEVTKVNGALLQSLVDNSFIPVVSTVAVDSMSGQALNVNADTAAGEIASALQVHCSSYIAAEYFVLVCLSFHGE